MKVLYLFATLVISAILLCSCGAIAEPAITDSQDNTSFQIPSNNPETTTPEIDTSIPFESLKPLTPSECPSAEDTQSSETLVPLSTSGTGTPTDGPDETINIAGMFSFGMSWEEAKLLLYPNGCREGDVERHGFSSVWDNWEGSYMDVTAFGYDGYVYSFLFDGANMLYEFYSAQVSTARGFAPGEGIARMIELYGGDYKFFEYNLHGYYVCFFEYDFGEYYLSFHADHDTDVIKSWEVSRCSYEERMWAAEQNEIALGGTS